MIKQIFNRLYNKSNTNNSIIFEINKDNKINLKCLINNRSKNDAENFGLLLFLINEGYYVQEFLDILSDPDKNNAINEKFIQQVINSWSKKVTDTNQYESIAKITDPVVKPTQFNTEK